MKIEIMLPSRILARDEVSSVVAEGHEGSFGILEGHIDYVSPLVPGILTYRTSGNGSERIFAVDEGVLVKLGREILVSVRDAVAGDDLLTLRQTVERRFRSMDEKERRARSALATLESRFIRRFIEQIGEIRG